MRYIKVALLGLLGVSATRGEDDQLEPLTVLADRFVLPKSETTSDVEVIRGEELERLQRNRLTESLNYFPGVQGLSTVGQTGSLGTVLMRGLSTRYVQTVVDGVRISDATGGSNIFLSAAQLGGISQLEVLRGPQSVLYGSGAAGGVIGYETMLGNGDGGSELLVEAGSFGHFRAAYEGRGQIGAVKYAVGFGYFETENDPTGGVLRHDYTEDSKMLALEWEVRDDLSVRVSYRGSEGRNETLSDSGFGPFAVVSETDVNLVALNVDYQVNPWWESRVTLGRYDDRFEADFLVPTYFIDYVRYTGNWRNRFEVSDRVRVVGGLEWSESDFESSDGRDVDYKTGAAYVNGSVDLMEGVLLEAGLRYEDHSEFGGDVAWQVGASYEVEGTRLRARVSEAYRAPTLLESEAFNSGFGAVQAANPNLESEKILGVDVSLEQEVGEHVLGVTYFRQELENAIGRGPTVAGSYSNVNLAGDSLVSGLELSAEGPVFGGLRYRLAWTEQFDEEVLDVPDRMVNLDVSYQGDSWSVGVGARYVDEASYGLSGVADARIVTRVYGEVEVSERIRIFGRVDNLFDEQYFISDDGFLPISGEGRGFALGARLEW